ncbi:MAG: mycofactocin biosynthesis glycosyltransferase MftF, partial [Mycobacterium sp.]
MTQPRLPDGFAVQVDRRVRVLGAGSALLGGSPTRLLRLAPAAQTLLSSGRLEVNDAVSAQLARTLLDATVAHPRPAGGPSHRDVTVVIPVRNNISGVRRLMAALRGLRVIIVDDGSTVPVAVSDFAAAPCAVEVFRHQDSRGPAAARNTGLAAAATDYVAFLDSDVVPRRGWLEALLGHFCDPAVALVAPRIVGLPQTENMVARYEAVRSSLDLGQREAPVIPYGPVSYVPSAAMICRRSALNGVGGFDETMRSGEDVDLCWRFIESGARLRYEPIALVAHEHRTQLRDWLSRKAFYGTSAAPLATRHPDKTAPLVISGCTLVVWLLMACGSRLGYVASMVALLVTGHRVNKAMKAPEAQPRDVVFVASRGL